MSLKIKESDFIVAEDGQGYSQSMVGKAVAATLIMFGIITAATIVKFAFIDNFGKILGKYTVLCYIAVVVAFLLVLSAFTIYNLISRKDLIMKIKELAAVYFCITVSYLACLFLSLLSVYYMPVFLVAFLMAAILKQRDTFSANLVTNIFIFMVLVIEAMITGGEILPVVIMFIIGLHSGTLVAYTVCGDPRRLNYLLKGTLINASAAGIMIILSFVFTDDPLSFVPGLAFLAVNVMISMLLGLISQPILERLFNLVTNSRLVELTDHDAPLIKRLIKEAPGTFNHSVSVAGFAQVCATAIGENPYLARACAYYHDIGTLMNPLYFKENQSDLNPHDNMLPEVSAEIIRNHTIDGLKLCREYHIPEEIAAVTVQHHGTMPISVFYHKATKLTDSEVDIDDYSYHGTPPATKMAAIIMICDSSEAAIRAMDMPDGERVQKLLNGLVAARIAAGQFDNCNITMHELSVIKETITSAYGGVFHTRIKYPEGK